jgi:phage gp36-like protein
VNLTINHQPTTKQKKGMIYLEIKDFLRVIQTEELKDVVGKYENPTDEGAVILDELEQAAIEEMTGYLSVRYDASTCFDTSDGRLPIIVQKCVDIVLYHAYSRVAPENIPNLRTARYDNAINWLEKTASGFIAPNLPVKPEMPTTPLRYGRSQPKTDNFF